MAQPSRLRKVERASRRPTAVGTTAGLPAAGTDCPLSIAHRYSVQLLCKPRHPQRGFPATLGDTDLRPEHPDNASGHHDTTLGQQVNPVWTLCKTPWTACKSAWTACKRAWRARQTPWRAGQTAWTACQPPWTEQKSPTKSRQSAWTPCQLPWTPCKSAWRACQILWKRYVWRKNAHLRSSPCSSAASHAARSARAGKQFLVTKLHLVTHPLPRSFASPHLATRPQASKHSFSRTRITK